MDITKSLFDFLWSCPHREGSGMAAGSGTEYIFEVKKSDLDKFEKFCLCREVCRIVRKDPNLMWC